MWKIKILEAQKEKLIRENAPNLKGFLHPDLIQRAKKIAGYDHNPGDTGYLSGYKIT